MAVSAVADAGTGCVQRAEKVKRRNDRDIFSLRDFGACAILLRARRYFGKVIDKGWKKHGIIGRMAEGCL